MSMFTGSGFCPGMRDDGFSGTGADLMNHGSFLLDKCPEQCFMPLRIILY